MEFRLNKIDPEVRRRVKETTSANRVHNKTGIFINKDNKNKKDNENEEFKSQLDKYKKKNKKRILVDAKKVEKIEVKAFKEEVNASKNYKIGSIIDTKK